MTITRCQKFGSYKEAAVFAVIIIVIIIIIIIIIIKLYAYRPLCACLWRWLLIPVPLCVCVWKQDIGHEASGVLQDAEIQHYNELSFETTESCKTS
jgi:hypothetical protein